MMFKAEMEMKMYLGEDEGDNSLERNVWSSAICIETLVNMRTVYINKIIEVKGDRMADCMLTFWKISWTQKLALYEEMKLV